MNLNPNLGPAPGARILISELFTFVRESVKDYPFPDPAGAWQDCRVFIHGFPEDQEDTVYPYVVVRWLEGEVSSESGNQTLVRDTVALILGVYAPRCQAEAGLLCAELLDCLRRAFWRERILANRFELMEPIRASIPSLQQKIHKYHMATIETVWNYVWPPKALENPRISALCGAI